MSNEHIKYIKKLKRNKMLVFLTQILIFLVFIIMWQISANLQLINTFLTSSPLNILKTIINLFNANNLFNHIWVTLYETLISFTLSIIIGIIVASVICWLNFVIIDTYFGLPQQPGVKGVQTVGDSIEKRNGDIAGGFFQGNILCSPDASAGTLIASIGYMILGIPGGILAAFFVFMGNRLCADPGYAGTTGSLTITVMLFVCSFVGLTPEMFIAGICIAILTIQGIDQVRASIILGKIAKKFNRHAKE